MTPRTHNGFFAPDLTVTIDEQGTGRPVLLLHGGGEQLFLGLEIAVQRRLGAADAFRDLGHGGALEAVLPEHLPGRARDGLAPCIRLYPQLALSQSYLNPAVHFSLDGRKPSL